MSSNPPPQYKQAPPQYAQQPQAAPQYAPQQPYKPQQAFVQQPQYGQPQQQYGQPQQQYGQPQQQPYVQQPQQVYVQQPTVTVVSTGAPVMGVPFMRFFPSQKRFVVAFLLGFIVISALVGVSATKKGWIRLTSPFTTADFEYGWREDEDGTELTDKFKEGGDAAGAFSVLSFLVGAVGCGIACLAKDNGDFPQKTIAVICSGVGALLQLLAFAVYAGKANDQLSSSAVTVELGYAGGLAVGGMICGFVALAMSAGPWTFPPSGWRNPQNNNQQQPR